MIGSTGKAYTSDQATIWRWRTAFQHDFAARMDWTIKDARSANHNPTRRRERPARQRAAGARRAGRHGRRPSTRRARPIRMAMRSRYSWFFYPEAGTGIPGQPVFAVRQSAARGRCGRRARAASRRRPPAARASLRRAS